MDDRHGKVGGSIRGAKPEDRKPICRLLTSAGLPSQDVTDAGLAHFLVCELDETVVGVVGLEPYGDGALVRSLAVAQSYRCRGIAETLLHEVQSLACQLGVKTLYTLTVTAQRYLEQQGFASVERDTVPASIRASTQFRGLCPDSALCLAKPVTEGGRT